MHVCCHYLTVSQAAPVLTLVSSWVTEASGPVTALVLAPVAAAQAGPRAQEVAPQFLCRGLWSARPTSARPRPLLPAELSPPRLAGTQIALACSAAGPSGLQLYPILLVSAWRQGPGMVPEASGGRHPGGVPGQDENRLQEPCGSPGSRGGGQGRAGPRTEPSICGGSTLGPASLSPSRPLCLQLCVWMHQQQAWAGVRGLDASIPLTGHLWGLSSPFGGPSVVP